MRWISRSLAVSSISGLVLHRYLRAGGGLDRALGAVESDPHFRGRAIHNHLRNYRKSFGRTAVGVPVETLTVNNLADDCAHGLTFVQQMAVVKSTSLIEIFLSCWVLNHLLAKLENGVSLEKYEIGVANILNPAISRNVASVGKLVGAHEYLRTHLEVLPPFLNDPKTRTPAEKAVDGNSAMLHLEFWREYRNHLIHRGGLASPTFADRWGDFFEQNFLRYYGHLSPIERSKPLPFHDDLFGAQAACFYRISRSLNEVLAKESGARRGHPHAPGPEVKYEGNVLSPPLLLPGDHEASLQWTCDENYRREVAAANGWRYYSGAER